MRGRVGEDPAALEAALLRTLLEHRARDYAAAYLCGQGEQAAAVALDHAAIAYEDHQGVCKATRGDGEQRPILAEPLPLAIRAVFKPKGGTHG